MDKKSILIKICQKIGFQDDELLQNIEKLGKINDGLHPYYEEVFIMAVKVAINGFGRIGRLAFRQMFKRSDHSFHARSSAQV